MLINFLFILKNINFRYPQPTAFTLMFSFQTSRVTGVNKLTKESEIHESFTFNCYLTYKLI